MFLRNRDLLTLVLTIAALAGCGGDDKKKADSTKSTDAALCRRICERSAKAECENDPADCTTQCGALISQTPDGCKSELEAFTKCAEKATFTCDEDDESEAESCDRQLSAWSRCVGADEPSGDDDDDGDDGATGSTDAGSPNSDASTSDEPVMPSAPDAALCEARAGESSCTACLKGECCDVLASCDEKCLQLVECASACSNNACAQKCLSGADPQVLQQFLYVATCLAESCDAACTSSATSNTPPAVILPDDCLPADAVPAGHCDNPETPNAYDCKTAPFSDCVASPTGVADIWCCAQ